MVIRVINLLILFWFYVFDAQDYVSSHFGLTGVGLSAFKDGCPPILFLTSHHRCKSTFFCVSYVIVFYNETDLDLNLDLNLNKRPPPLLATAFVVMALGPIPLALKTDKRAKIPPRP